MNKQLEYMKVSLMIAVFIVASICSAHLALATVEKELDNQSEYINNYDDQINEKESGYVY